jgi:hypothetical protein
LLVVLGLTEDMAADQMMDAVVAVLFVLTMTAPLPPGPGLPLDPPSKKRMYLLSGSLVLVTGISLSGSLLRASG